MLLALQVIAVLAVAAAAIFTIVVAGIYLRVRFTQHRRTPRGGGGPPASTRP